MRILRSKAATNEDAKRAIDLFVYRIRREIGSLVAALDALIFTAGIGENDAATRAEVIAGLGWAGLALDEAANRAGGPLISSGPGPTAWVVPTNAELVIARQTQTKGARTQGTRSTRNEVCSLHAQGVGLLGDDLRGSGCQQCRSNR